MPDTTHHNLLDELIDFSLSRHGAAFADLQLVDRANGLLRLARTRNLPPVFRQRLAAVPIYDASAGARAFRSAGPYFVPDILADRTFAAYHALASLVGFRAVSAIPIAIDGQIAGVVCARFAEPRTSPSTAPLDVQAWIKLKQPELRPLLS